MISHKHKCIFIHIAKTGGTSIEKCLIKKDWWDIDRKTKHLSAKSAKIIYKDYWKDYYKFSFVRNPWDIMVSWYRFRKVKEFFGMDFKSFLLSYDFSLPTSSGEKSWLPNSLLYTDLLFDKGKPLINFIGKFEKLQKDFNIICEQIGILQTKLTHEHRSNRKHYTEYYDDETKQIVSEKYAKDIKYFGYKFGD